MERDDRRKAFQKKAEVGYWRNEICLSNCMELQRRYEKGEITLSETLTLAWGVGCEYGKDHAEQLKVFDR